MILLFQSSITWTMRLFRRSVPNMLRHLYQFSRIRAQLGIMFPRCGGHAGACGVPWIGPTKLFPWYWLVHGNVTFGKSAVNSTRGCCSRNALCGNWWRLLPCAVLQDSPSSCCSLGNSWHEFPASQSRRKGVRRKKQQPCRIADIAQCG